MENEFDQRWFVNFQKFLSNSDCSYMLLMTQNMTGLGFSAILNTKGTFFNLIILLFLEFWLFSRVVCLKNDSFFLISKTKWWGFKMDTENVKLWKLDQHAGCCGNKCNVHSTGFSGDTLPMLLLKLQWAVNNKQASWIQMLVMLY